MCRRVMAFLCEIGVFLKINKYYVITMEFISIMVYPNITNINLWIIFEDSIRILIKP